MKQKRYTVAVVGATGAVGTEMLRVLEERRFPVGKLRLLASERSTGRQLAFNGSRHRVEPLQKRSFDGVDVALFSAGAARSLAFGPEAVKRGAVVVDNSSAFRMKDGVPLVVPEVNPQALRGHQGLIANPNCSTIVMLVPLKPLHDAARIRRIIVSTYQSVSGAGAKAMAQLYDETKQAMRQLRVSRSEFRVNSKLETRNSKLPRALPNQIAFNVIPQVDVFLANRSTKEEMKMVNETRKILEEPMLAMSATCVRVPVFVAHSEAVWIETERPLSVEDARRLLRKAPGVRLVDDAARSAYPMPVDAAGRDEVLVGRIRKDESVANGLALWVSGDNLRKGAATNAIQIAELLIR
ncbi:MAG: aspartate-semialdehyde dehydrogenase [Candidatus Omnitrophica bacterium]|nr:aspartate-semialdehyde dehydrogenase [Candidatus Omnitrophota bacterium]